MSDWTGVGGPGEEGLGVALGWGGVSMEGLIKGVADTGLLEIVLGIDRVGIEKLG